MSKSKPERNSEKHDDKSRSKERSEDLPVKDEKAANVKGGAAPVRGLTANHNETLLRA